MKRVIFSAVLLFSLGHFASAQTATGNASTTTGAVSNPSPKEKKNKKPSDSLNNREIYKFKNGQRSTPTGAEATPSAMGGGYAALGRPDAAAQQSDTVAAPAQTITQRSETSHGAKKQTATGTHRKGTATKAKRKQ